MRLRKGDELIALVVSAPDADLLVVTENGYGKRTRLEEYAVKGRGGLGVKTIPADRSPRKTCGRSLGPRWLSGDADIDRGAP